MGVSIVLYRVQPAENFEDLVNLEKQLESEEANSIDLYKMYHDIAIIFTNSIDPYTNIDDKGYKVLFGNPMRVNVGANEIGGFISTSQVVELNRWIKDNGLETLKGFYKMFTGLSEEAKAELIEIGDVDLITLHGYVKNLAEMFDASEKNQNSIVVCAE